MDLQNTQTEVIHNDQTTLIAVLRHTNAPDANYHADLGLVEIQGLF